MCKRATDACSGKNYSTALRGNANLALHSSFSSNSSMEVGTHCAPSGVPTTPRPLKPAPEPRYNDLTRPACLREDAYASQELHLHPPARGSGSFFNANSGGEALHKGNQSKKWPEVPARNVHQTHLQSASISGHAGSEPFFFEQEGKQRQQGQQDQEGRRRKLSSSSLDLEFPDPWQGNIDLPENDEEIMNTAQNWVRRILLRCCEDEDIKNNVEVAKDILVDGSALCRVVNAIASGSVENIHVDSNQNADNMRSFSVACRKFGVPAGALFDVHDPDPRRVGQCLHVLSRVVRDTVPDFQGPFLSTSNLSSPSTPDGSTCEDHGHLGSCRNVAGGHPEEPSSSSQEWPWGTNGACNSPQKEDRRHQRFEQFEESLHTEDLEHNHPRPPTPPARPRPLSFPSRFSPSSPTDDAMWNSLFPSPASIAQVRQAAAALGTAPEDGNSSVAGLRGGDGEGQGIGGRDEEAMDHAATWQVVEGAREEQDDFERSFSSASSSASPTSEAGVVEASLSKWLLKLNLGAFQGAIANIGVQTMEDLRYVEEQDLKAIGMHGPQTRKFLQNRP